MSKPYSANPSADARPRVTASFVEPDESGTALLVAVGQAIIAAAGLEKALQVELVGLLFEEHATEANPNLEAQLSEADSLTAGQLMRRLKDLNLPRDLDVRIADAIARRNKLVHHTFEDPDVARFALDGESVGVLVDRINQLANDCAALTVELHLVAVPRLELALGKSRAELIQMARAIDVSTISNPTERKQLEAIQGLASIDGLAEALDDLAPDPGEPGASPSH